MYVAKYRNIKLSCAQPCYF